jgi:hypothetical protein
MAAPIRFKCRSLFSPSEREELGLEDDEGYQCVGRCTRPVRAAQFRKNGEYAILHPSPKPGYRWQLTWFDDEGPWGDTEVADCNDGVKQLLEHWPLVRRGDGGVVPGFKLEDWD